MSTWQQKKIGRDLVAASEQLAQAKRIGNAGGTLAQGISADLQAAARRKVANLVDLAAKYHSSKPTIAKDEAPAVTWAEISAASPVSGKFSAALSKLPNKPGAPRNDQRIYRT